MPEREVDVLPLVSDLSKDERSTGSPTGWVTYSDDFKELPEVEYFCGGINVKHPTAAGLWRQGNLLHFAFEQSPAELNQTGQALLLNSIAYISRFTEDRPIAKTPSVFAGPYPRARARVISAITNESIDLGYLQYYLAPSTFGLVKKMDRAVCRAWLAQNGTYLYPNKDGLLAVDEQAKSFGTPYDSPEFFEKAIAALGTPGDSATQARRLLARFAPEGPGDGSAELWASWWKDNRPYLFFSFAGGYRWYIDPLAKKRAIPTADLRGSARATPPKSS
jgi:hypothetical protein